MRTRKLYQIIADLELLMEDFNEADKYVLVADMEQYSNSILTYFESTFKGRLVWVSTDSYGAAGFACFDTDLSEAIEEYIDSLEPADSEEKECWTETTDTLMFKDLFNF